MDVDKIKSGSKDTHHLLSMWRFRKENIGKCTPCTGCRQEFPEAEYYYGLQRSSNRLAYVYGTRTIPVYKSCLKCRYGISIPIIED